MLVQSGVDETNLTVDSTSKAARVSLYDSNGRLVVRPKYLQPEPQVYSYCVGMVNTVGLTTGTIPFLFINRDNGRRIRLRQMNIEMNQFNANTAAQSTVQIDKVKFASADILTGAGAVNPVATYLSPVAKVYNAPPASALCVSAISPTASFSAPTRTDTATICQVAIPARPSSRGTLEFFYDSEGPDGEFRFDYLEGIIWTVGGTVVSNAMTIHLDWDEEILTN